MIQACQDTTRSVCGTAFLSVVAGRFPGRGNINVPRVHFIKDFINRLESPGFRRPDKSPSQFMSLATLLNGLAGPVTVRREEEGAPRWDVVGFLTQGQQYCPFLR
jgi:hypothetical protein